MSKATCLITGSTGLLGRAVTATFQSSSAWTTIGTAFSRAQPPLLKLDLNSPSQIEALFLDIQPNVVIHCAANRFPDKCDSDPDGARKLNIEATRVLAKICAQSNVLMVYISTDYVFPGTEGDAPYAADAPTDPPNFYGRTKLDGESAVLDVFSSAGKRDLGVVLRVPVLYGEVGEVGNSESAVNVLLDSVMDCHRGRQVTMDHWSLRYPTNVVDVGRVLLEISSLYLIPSTTPRPSILQFSSEDRYTKYEICELLAALKGISLGGKMVANTAGTDPSAAVKRPFDCHLSTSLLKELGISVHTVNFEEWWRKRV